MNKFLSFLAAALIMVALVSFSGCKKDDENIALSFELRFTNISNNPYLITVNGSSSVIPGNTFKNYDLESGFYDWKVTQQSGYLLYPTTKEGTILLNQDREIVFP